ncbi:MAG TPA: hypothetical protein DIT97_05070 [Gimesia maris]|mgnify:CR=1 FL=1|uniref:DUF4393 domain-containing protein n=1 Tax=Gimesia maris TaxID=122 RepID=A0A3D3R2L3_9PLAN|nr:hypothetical protein [Gimesia maris]|tara:strand:- start:1954 stop:2625 length:672 start_codon:yes stop_codon:yes gene_type:complete
MTNEDMATPRQTRGDVAHTIVKAGLSSVPVIGGAAVELFQHVVQPPLEKRRAEWMEQVGQRLKELEENGLDLESLQDNDQFISAAMHASQIALRTHQEEKLEALRNAVLNIATGQSPGEARQHMFLNFVDVMTETHIRILKLFQFPNSPPPQLFAGGLSNMLEHYIPEMRGQRELYDQMWSDLNSKGLVTTPSLHGMMSANGLMVKRTSEFGDSFLGFITMPE